MIPKSMIPAFPRRRVSSVGPQARQPSSTVSEDVFSYCATLRVSNTPQRTGRVGRGRRRGRRYYTPSSLFASFPEISYKKKVSLSQFRNRVQGQDHFVLNGKVSFGSKLLTNNKLFASNFLRNVKAVFTVLSLQGVYKGESTLDKELKTF